MIVLHRLVQQHLLGLALVPAAAGPPDGPVTTPKVARVEAAASIAARAAADTAMSHRRCPLTRTPPGSRAIRHPDQRPVDRAHLQVPYR